MTEFTIGVDISKFHLDAFRLEDQAAQQFDNSPCGFRALIKWLGKLPVTRIVFEPTGPYHRAFEAALGEKFPLVKVNPLQARRFAEASGTRAKTDAVDARGLARMGVALDLQAQEPVSESMSVLKDLHVARTSLIKERTRLKNRAKTMTFALLMRQSKARLAQVERQIKELDGEIATRIAQEAPKARNRDILCSIPGLADLAPFSRQSGKWQGKSFIGGGRNGSPILTGVHRRETTLTGISEGFSKISVIDAAGRSARVTVRNDPD